MTPDLRALKRGPGLRRGIGVIQFVLAGIVLLLVAYLLSWRILWDGLAGSDSPYHLNLTSWIASSFWRLSCSSFTWEVPVRT